MIGNMYHQFVSTPCYAFRLAGDKEFTSKTGLDGIGLIKRIWQLFPRVGFVFAMRDTFRIIKRRYPNLDLDSKFVALIYSRIRMIPEISMRVDPWAYAAAQLKVIKNSRSDGWEKMSIYDKFFEVSLACVIQEECLDPNPGVQAMLPLLGESFFRELYSLLFSKIFKYKGWVEP